MVKLYNKAKSILAPLNKKNVMKKHDVKLRQGSLIPPGEKNGN